MKRKAIYTQAEIELNVEAGHNTLRMLEATWITGTGPRGGRINVGQARYDMLNMLVIEDKAEVVARFSASQMTASVGKLEIMGLIIRFPKIKEVLPVAVPVQTTALTQHLLDAAKLDVPPWEG